MCNDVPYLNHNSTIFCSAATTKGTEKAWIQRSAKESLQAPSWGQAHCEVRGF
jgi:hypothetical protein